MNRWLIILLGVYLLVLPSGVNAAVNEASALKEDCPLVIASIDAENPSDCNLNNGSIVIEVVGGNGAYEYSINDGATWQESHRFQDLPAGTFLIIARQLDGTCQTNVAEVVNLQGPDSPRFISVTSNNPTDCGLEDGSIAIEARGGTGPYGYSIDGGETWGASDQFFGLAAGVYRAMVRNANGTCETPYIFPIELVGPVAPEILTVNVGVQSDCGANDGSIDIITSGNSGDLLYSIDGQASWSQEATTSNLGAGTYEAWVSNADGSCPVYYGPLTIPSIEVPSYSNVIAEPPSDCGVTNGSIKILAEGNYQYQLNGGLWQTSPNFTNLAAGGYTVNLRNSDGSCLVETARIEIDAPIPPTIDAVSFSAPSDCETLDGQIQISAIAGSEALSYSFDGGQSWSLSPNLFALGNGDFDIRVRNQSGSCEQQYGPIQLRGPQPPEIIQITDINPSACDKDNGFISISIEEIDGPYEYSIDSGQTWSFGNQFVQLPAGTYFPMVRKLTGNCLSTSPDPIVLTAPERPTINDIEVQNPTDCGQVNGRIEIIATAETPLQYSIDDGQSWQAQAVFSNLDGGRYQILVRTNNEGCIQNGPIVNLESPRAPTVNVVIEEPTACGVADGQLSIIPNGDEPIEYSLDGGASWQSSRQFADLGEGEYNLLIRREDGSCETTYPTLIRLNPPSLPIFSIAVQDPSDCDRNDGSIRLSTTENITGLRFSIDNGATWSNTPFFNHLEKGEYAVLVQNTNTACISEESNLIVLQGPEPPPFRVTLTQPSVCGGTDGRIQLGPLDAGEGQYRYSIDGGQSWHPFGLFVFLPPGSYQLMARNADGSCLLSWEETVTLLAPENPQVDIEVKQPTQCNEPNGQLYFLPAQTEAGFEYSIDGGLNWSEKEQYDGLPPGAYELLTRYPGQNCQFGAKEIILEAPPFPENLDVVTAAPSSCEQLDGEISIIPPDSNQNWSYSLDNGQNWSNQNQWNDLAAGTYLILLRNEATQCLSPEPTTISLANEDTPIINNVSFTAVSDCTEGNGSIEIEITNETAEYLFSIDDGQTWQAEPSFHQLDYGSYTVQVSNPSAECTAIFQPTLTLDHPLLSPIVAGNSFSPSACGLDDGRIELSLQEMEHELEFSIDNGLTWQADPEFSHLAAGDYEVLVRGGNNDCTPTTFDVFSLASPTINLAVEIRSLPPSDCQVSDGEIWLANTALENLSYRLNEGDWQPTAHFDQLTAGSYTLHVRDTNNNCVGTIGETIMLEEPTTPVPSVTWTNPSACGRTNGTIAITMAGAEEEDFEFSIDGGNQWQVSSVFEELPAASYQVRVRRINSSCAPQGFAPMVTLVEQAAPALQSATFSPPSICGAADGTIVVNTAPDLLAVFSLNNQDWVETGHFDGLPAGTYTLQIRYEGTTCEALVEEEFILQAPTNLAPLEIETEAITDCGITNGRISFLSTNANYQYSIDGGNSWQSSPVFNQLGADTYYPRISTIDGACQSETLDPIQLEAPDRPLVMGIISEDPSACLQTDGSIRFQVQTAADYRFSIDNGQTWQSSPVFSDLAVGRYLPVVKRRGSQCQIQSFGIDLNLPPTPEIIQVKVEPALGCQGIDGSIEIQAIGEGPLLYSIDAGQSWSPDPVFENLIPTHYTIVVRGENSCPIFYREAVKVGAIEAIAVELVESLAPSCSGNNDAMIRVEAQGGLAPYSYRWSNGVTSAENADIPAGIYTVTVSDTRQCEQVLPFTIEEPPALTISLGEDVESTLCLGQSLSYDFEDEGYTYRWGSDNGFESTASTISLNEPGHYWVEVTNESGCTASDSVLLLYREEFFNPDFLLPTAGLAGTPIVAIDISWPIPDEILWEYNTNEVIHQETYFNQEIVMFPNVGTYNIRLYAKKGECEGVLDKTITIYNDPDSLQNQGLGEETTDHVLDFSLYPNPNNGTFDARVQLDETQNVKIWVFDGAGTLMESRELDGFNFYLEHFSLSNAQAGLYNLVLQTQDQWYYLNFIVGD